MSFSSSLFNIIVVVVSFFLFFAPRLSQSLNSTSPYDACAPFSCGKITNISFPFSRYRSVPPSCGLPQYLISCDNASQATILLSGSPFQVIDLNLNPEERLIVVSDTNLANNLAFGDCRGIKNLSLVPSGIAPLQHPASSTYLHLYSCSHELDPTQGNFVEQVLNYSNCQDGMTLYLSRSYSDFTNETAPSAPGDCSHVVVPVLPTSLLQSNKTISSERSLRPSFNWSDLLDVVRGGFWLQWPEVAACTECSSSGGRCGFEASPSESDENSGQVVCFYKESSGRVINGSKSSRTRKVIIGTTASAFIVLVLVALFISKFGHKVRMILDKDYFRSKRSKENDRNVEEFIKSYRSMLVTKYSYTNIHRMTNGFKDKLGEGGYGNVFKGKLADGRTVAVKMLEKVHDNGQDFINEVATIGTIHHVNIIRLLGFSWEGLRRALVYEFMPNGSLGDLISKEDVKCFLGWHKLLEIAIGIAHGVEYLHQGCDTRILHLDIKPHNVLLDENYNPKISDFGLAKSYSRNQSVVPVTNAKGTIGYIAPEIFLRNLGGVSHKSDVYSYGMLLLEMVGGRKHVKIKDERSSMAYFPNWIYNQLEQEKNNMELVDSILEEGTSIAKKMSMIGLWCVQINPSDRPSMNRVVEMLKGSVEGIEMPPKPFLFSPPRPQPGSAISITESDSNDLPLMYNDST